MKPRSDDAPEIMLKRVFSVAQLLADGTAEDTNVAQRSVPTHSASDSAICEEKGKFDTSSDCGRVLRQPKRRS